MPPRSAQDQRLRLQQRLGGAAHLGPLLLLASPRIHTESTSRTWALPQPVGLCNPCSRKEKLHLALCTSIPGLPQAPTSLCDDLSGTCATACLPPKHQNTQTAA